MAQLKGISYISYKKCEISLVTAPSFHFQSKLPWLHNRNPNPHLIRIFPWITFTYAALVSAVPRTLRSVFNVALKMNKITTINMQPRFRFKDVFDTITYQFATFFKFFTQIISFTRVTLLCKKVFKIQGPSIFPIS